MFHYTIISLAHYVIIKRNHAVNYYGSICALFFLLHSLLHPFFLYLQMRQSKIFITGTRGSLKPMLYTLPLGRCNHLFFTRSSITEVGTTRFSTRLTGCSFCNRSACGNVLGNPVTMPRYSFAFTLIAQVQAQATISARPSEYSFAALSSSSLTIQKPILTSHRFDLVADQRYHRVVRHETTVVQVALYFLAKVCERDISLTLLQRMNA